MKLFKRLMVAVSALAMVVTPLAAHAVDQVTIESVSEVSNTTQGTGFGASVNAHDDDVVKVQVTYHNMEDADSGKIAQNLKVKIAVPTTTGATHDIASTVSADNSNTVVSHVTVNTNNANATLEYIPGSAKWRHNTGTNANPNWVTEGISDQVTTSGLVLENEQPCFNFAASVTILARVKAPLVSIVKQVRVVGTHDFVVEDTAKVGDTLQYVLIVKNEGNTVLTGVQVGDNMPPHITYINGTTTLVNSLTGPGGKVLGDGITTGGITIDEMNPGSTQYIYFKAKIDADMPCGNNHLRNVGIVRALGTNQIFNVAFTNVTVACGGGTVPPVTPPTTSQLPQTGAEGAAGLLGFSALGYSTKAWIRSKRNLLKALKNKR